MNLGEGKLRAVNSALFVELPLNLKLGNKNYTLSMNNYRNWHHLISNNLKKLFEKSIYIPKFKAEKIKVSYEVYFKDKTRRDLMNFVSVADKFFLDCLVKKGYIPDDNYLYVSYDSIKFAGYSNVNKIDVRIEII